MRNKEEGMTIEYTTVKKKKSQMTDFKNSNQFIQNDETTTFVSSFRIYFLREKIQTMKIR